MSHEKKKLFKYPKINFRGYLKYHEQTHYTECFL